jgi:hypothetical protein
LAKYAIAPCPPAALHDLRNACGFPISGVHKLAYYSEFDEGIVAVGAEECA